ncbi:protein-tyrosine phosphatase family protein [Streptomyces sp. NPDC058751]|uniref:protein-tyrosine phosphatase family protein n=1 Tax=Streptomyces sp. NPDC058751 TaxID=3346623 RepID=UPI0036A091C3
MTDIQPDSSPASRAGGGTWDADGAGVLALPSGRLIRGRGLRRPLPADGGPEPAYAVYLLGKEPPQVPWEAHWLRWPDFRLPADRAEAREVIARAWERAAGERVEIACHGGRGRTGTALACVAVLDGVPPEEAVAYVRRHYDRHAVETPWQRAYVRRFGTRD